MTALRRLAPTPSAAPTPDPLTDVLARRVVELLTPTLDALITAALANAVSPEVDQSCAPAPLSRRKYLEHARAGRFPSRKEGKQVIAKRTDVLAFVATLGTRVIPREPSNSENPSEPHEESLEQRMARKRAEHTR